MEKICIFIVFSLSLFFPIAFGRMCSYNKFYDKAKDACVPCPACAKGTQFSDNCGYNLNGERTADAQCKPCRLGMTYKDRKSTEPCANCDTCDDGKVKTAQCTLTSNTVCECPKGTYSDNYGVCRQIATKAPVTSPVTTPTSPVTTTPPKTPPTSRGEEPKHNETQKPSPTVISKSPEVKPDGLNAAQKDNHERPILQTGWIVLICLVGFLLVTAVIFLSCHKRTRKQVSGFCCRKYHVLWPDHDSADRDVTSDLVRAEGHYAEEQAATSTNYAEPIPPWNEPVPPMVKSSSTPEQVYCSCMAKDIDHDKIQCACTQTNSDPTIDKMAHTSSSAETISEEVQHYFTEKKQGIQTPTRKTSPPPSSSSGVFSSRSSDQCHSTSPCVTPPRGLSPNHRCVTTPSPSSSRCVTPHRWSPVHHCMQTSSSSACVTPPRGLSPECFCVTPSSASTSPAVTPRMLSPDLYCVTSSSNSSSTCVTPLRGRSPDPQSIPSVQIQVAEEQEVSNQSNECSQIPISIEASDKKHEISKTKSSIISSPTAKKKRLDSKPTGKRENLSPTKELLCACQHELYLKSHWPIEPTHSKETEDREKVVPGPVPHGNKNTESTVTGTGNDLKMEDEIKERKVNTNALVNNHDECRYRPINRDEETEHRCQECCPQPSDSFFKLIYRERQCLKEEICKKLNVNSSFKELAILGRVDSEMQKYEASSNPAERVLEKLNASNPDLKLEEFEEMLDKIKRRDTVAVIHNHHLSCTLCQRNKFDLKA